MSLSKVSQEGYKSYSHYNHKQLKENELGSLHEQIPPKIQLT